MHVDANGIEHKGYQSYLDLWHMVDWAGYQTIYVDEIDPQSDNTYIFTPMNGECANGWNAPKAQIILWQMEWQLTDEHNAPNGVSRVWCSDAAFAKRNKYEYVPMGGDILLNETADTSYKLYDVALLSYQTPRRQIVTQQLQDSGLTIAPNIGLQGWVRSMVLNQSSMMVHTHQTETGKGIAPLRWCLAAAHHLPLITETIPDRGMFEYKHMIQSSYDLLAPVAKGVLMDKRLLRDCADALYQLLCCEWTFKRSVEANV